eukprot:11660682-Ditylum_brightwellii.AAC.1
MMKTEHWERRLRVDNTFSAGEDFSVTAQHNHMENQVLKMLLHVENAWKMHALAKEKSLEAKHDIEKILTVRGGTLLSWAAPRTLISLTLGMNSQYYP